jgi:hypothetical protein
VPPALGINLVDRSDRPGDAGIVDQNIQPAHRAQRLVEKPVDSRGIGDIGQRGAKPGQLFASCRELKLVDIADMNPDVRRHQGLRYCAPDTICAGGYDGPFSRKTCQHADNPARDR